MSLNVDKYVEVEVRKPVKPEVLVPAACVDKHCRGLRRAVETASFDAFLSPGYQMLVVTDKHRGWFCRPRIYIKGLYVANGVGNRPRLQGNPFIHEGAGTVSRIIERAIERGATYMKRI